MTIEKDHINKYSIEELENEITKKKEEGKLVKNVLKSFDTSNFKKIVIDKLKKNKQRIISEAIESNQKEIIDYIKKENNYLVEKNIDAEIKEKEIIKYVTNKLNNFYQQVIKNSGLDSGKMVKEKPKSTYSRCSYHGRVGSGGIGLSGSNGGPIGKLEKVFYRGE